ncbi:MAG: penicillin-binding protein 2 [bacterium]|nr:penicillin-binding protein 2 [bacterium]
MTRGLFAHWREYLVLACIIMFGFMVIAKLASLQIFNHGLYKALAQGQQQKSSLQVGERGTIYMQDKQRRLVPLATTHDISFLYASPQDVEDTKNTSTALAIILEQNQETIFLRLEQKDRLFSQLSRQLTQEQEEMVRVANLPGIHIGKEARRLYPQGTLASHVVGFINQDGMGQYGLEAYYHEILQGKEELLDMTQNPARYLRQAFGSTPERGASLVLTIDSGIQSFAETALDKTVERLNAKEGTIIVADPFTGKILALATTPRYDPNEYTMVSNFSLFINPATQNLYEPGSVLKALTMAAALDRGVITPDTLYKDTGSVRIGGRTISNYNNRVFGEQTMTQVLQFSINTGAVFAQQQLGDSAFMEYLERFGIFEKTGIDLSGEAFSRNTEFKKGYAINFATASFGQGIEMTAMQVVRIYSAFANGGFLVQPHLGEKIIVNGEEQVLEYPVSITAVLSPKASAQITHMLERVLEDGFGKQARIPGYKMAGKTGTSQIAWSALGIQKPGYSDQSIQSFVGYGPTSNPQFVILISLRDPQTKTAEYSAMPLYKEVAQYILDYYAIPPDAD